MNLTDQHKKILKGKICPYCKKSTEYVDSVEIYGRSYGMIYLCRDCKAWVGVHKGTDRALGRLANEELREWKKKAHAHFDPLWKNTSMHRTTAYLLLADYLGIPDEYCHIGMFSVETCKKVIEFADNYNK